MSIQTPKQSFCLVSIEPLDLLEPQVREIAADHGFVLNSEDVMKKSAPFCGYDYFYQDMTLSDNRSKGEMNGQLKNCIAAIVELTEDNFADGFVKVR